MEEERKGEWKDRVYKEGRGAGEDSVGMASNMNNFKTGYVREGFRDLRRNDIGVGKKDIGRGIVM